MRLRLLAALAGIVAAHSANAAIITTPTTLAQTYITAGASANGTFDINAAAGPGGLGYGTPYAITGATMTFNFADDGDAMETTSSVTSTLQTFYLQDPGCTGCSLQATTVVVDRRFTNRVDPSETVSVTSADMTRTGGTSVTYYDSYTTGISPSMVTSCGFFGCSSTQQTRYTCDYFLGVVVRCYQAPVYTQTTTTTTIFNGGFSIVMTLDVAALSDLAADGLLDFTLSGLTGDLNFLSASISVNLDPTTAVDNPPVAQVPEPNTLPLLAISLGALGWTVRRRPGAPVAARRTRAPAPARRR